MSYICVWTSLHSENFSGLVSHFLPPQLLHQQSAPDFVLEAHLKPVPLCYRETDNDSVFTPVLRYTEGIEDSVHNI
jgi:hypothetical protein